MCKMLRAKICRPARLHPPGLPHRGAAAAEHHPGLAGCAWRLWRRSCSGGARARGEDEEGRCRGSAERGRGDERMGGKKSGRKKGFFWVILGGEFSLFSSFKELNVHVFMFVWGALSQSRAVQIHSQWLIVGLCNCFSDSFLGCDVKLCNSVFGWVLLASCCK